MKTFKQKLQDKLTRKYDPKKNKKVFCAIPNETMISLMGMSRWNRIITAVKEKYKTDKIHVEFTKPPTLIAGGVGGTLLGKVAQVEKWAIKFLKEKK